jgi:hypothetical protein
MVSQGTPMTDTSADVMVQGPLAQAAGRLRAGGTLALGRGIDLTLVAGAAFLLYAVSSFIVQGRNATAHFGADAHLYALLAKGQIHDRVARFHPVTVALAVTWMSLLKPLVPWVGAAALLKAMFAAVGAVGVRAAMSAFAALAPRGCTALWGMIYAASFGVWYFSSIEESKIVTATLSALYIAAYLQLRAHWTRPRAALLTGILLLACLNEIVSGFLVVIPLVDILVRRGWDWRHGRWLAAHALAGPVALLVLEGLINGRLVAAGSNPEGTSHLGMLLFYMAKNSHGAADLYAFLVNWLFFNIAAPTAHAHLWVSGLPGMGSYFEPALANYLASPASAALVALLGAALAAGLLSRRPVERPGAAAGMTAALLAYTLLRAAFFFIFNPREPLLFSPAVSLAHLLMVAMLLAAWQVPAKRTLLALAAALLLVSNGAFIIGR